jgi:hypothetical protein
VNRFVPTSLFAPNLFVRFLHSINSESNCYIQIWIFLQNARYIREDSGMNLSVRHYINRIEFVVSIKRVANFRQILARERFAARENQNTEIAAERFRYFFDFFGFHLQLFTRTVIEFVREETVRAAHIAN